MLRIKNIEELQGMLLEIPSLVDQQKHRDPKFIQNVEQWLYALEKSLENNHMPIVGNVAALRGVLISASRGTIPDGIEFLGRCTKHKIFEETAAHVLRQTGNLISNEIQKDCERVAEAERLTRQMIALAKTKKLIKELPSGNNFMDILKTIWKSMSADPELSPGTISIEGLIGPYDALIVLDRTLTSDISK
jgi:hypothetical protein